LSSLISWSRTEHPALLTAARHFAHLARTSHTQLLPGPTGERNTWSLVPRTAILCLASSDADRLLQLAAVLACRSRAVWPTGAQPLLRRLPPEVQARIQLAADWAAPTVAFDGVLLHGSAEELAQVQRVLAEREGPVIAVERLDPGDAAIPMERLVVERSVSINTAAAGGNATLMTLA
jgi:RHH-type proline utilization regulon transcriptional repressor/proline dehydrogenase/delta 1-pyrroline-5-carboxylate dehydrogenase